MADRFGISYQLEAGALPADGRPHTLTVPLGAGNGIAYPLRVTGFGLQYDLPMNRAGPAQLVISAIRPAGAAGPAGPAASLGHAGELLRSFGSASPPGPFGLLRKQPKVAPGFIGGQGLTLDYTTGSGFGPPIHSCGVAPNRHPCGPPGTVPASWR